jgi:hypothetical protein
MTPNKNPTKKSCSKLCHENHKKSLQKSQKGETGETTKSLEEPHRIFYTYKEGSYKV